jgi:hypothetical protein
MPYFLYPKDASFDINLAPFGPNLIGATTDLDEAISMAKKNNAAIELWEHNKPPTTV